jgi:glycosyltransferase involved in cell wall biosynthesis
MGGHSASKGFDLLPVIVRVVDRSTHRSIRWLLFCDGLPDEDPRASDWPEAGDLTHSEVRFVGRVSDPRDAYAQADLVLHPSFVESFGRVCAEAMANGIPVVASDIPGLRAVVGNNEAGLLFPRGDSEAAAAAVVQLVNDLKLREVLGGRGRTRAREWNPAGVIQAFLRLYGWHTSDARIGPGSIDQ